MGETSIRRCGGSGNGGGNGGGGNGCGVVSWCLTHEAYGPQKTPGRGACEGRECGVCRAGGRHAARGRRPCQREAQGSGHGDGPRGTRKEQGESEGAGHSRAGGDVLPGHWPLAAGSGSGRRAVEAQGIGGEWGCEYQPKLNGGMAQVERREGRCDERQAPTGAGRLTAAAAGKSGKQHGGGRRCFELWSAARVAPASHHQPQQHTYTLSHTHTHTLT